VTARLPPTGLMSHNTLPRVFTGHCEWLQVDPLLQLSGQQMQRLHHCLCQSSKLQLRLMPFFSSLFGGDSLPCCATSACVAV